MKLHSREEILNIAKSLAQMVHGFKDKRVKSLGGDQCVCAEVETLDEQAKMVLRYFEETDEGLGDA